MKLFLGGLIFFFLQTCKINIKFWLEINLNVMTGKKQNAEKKWR